MKCWIWRAVPGELKDQVISGMLVECCLDQQLLCISPSELLISIPTWWWRCSSCCQQTKHWDIFEKAVETTVLFGHVELAVPGIMVDEGVSLGLGVGDCSTIMRHGFIGGVAIWCAIEASNDFPYIWAVSIWHRTVQEILPAIGLGFLDSNICFSTSINPFLLVLMYSKAEAVLVADLYSDRWIDPRLQFLTWFGSADMKWGWRFEDVAESWDMDGNVRLFWKLLHLWFNLIGKRGPVDAIAAPPGLPWDD